MSVAFDYSYNIEWLKSPGYLLMEVPDIVKDEVIETLNNLNEEESEDYRKSLAGHIEKEFRIDAGPNLTYLVETLADNYEHSFNIPNTFSVIKDGSMENGTYVLDTAWVNYSKKYDFNPLHSHSGVYSFVLWVQVPYDIEEEQKKYDPNGNVTGCFSFYYLTGLGDIATLNLPVDKSWEWRLAFFPAKMKHSVNPFYTSEDYRISISGNIKIQCKNE